MRTDIYKSWSSFAAAQDSLTRRSRDQMRAQGVKFLAYMLEPALNSVVDSQANLKGRNDINRALEAQLQDTDRILRYIDGCSHSQRSMLRLHMSKWASQTGFIPDGVFPQKHTPGPLDQIVAKSSHLAEFDNALRAIVEAGVISKAARDNYCRILTRFLKFVALQEFGSNPSLCPMQSAQILDRRVKEDIERLARRFTATRDQGGPQPSKHSANSARSVIMLFNRVILKGAKLELKPVKPISPARLRRPRSRVKEGKEPGKIEKAPSVSPRKPKPVTLSPAVVVESTAPSRQAPIFPKDETAERDKYIDTLKHALSAISKSFGFNYEQLSLLGVNSVRIINYEVRVLVPTLPGSRSPTSWKTSQDSKLVKAVRAYMDLRHKMKFTASVRGFFVDFDGKAFSARDCHALYK